MLFNDRIDAGLKLAHKLTNYKNNKNAAVLGLPCGGVVVAAEVARELHLAMDVIIVRKIGAPSNPDLAIGALTSGGSTYFNEPLMHKIGVTINDLTPIIESAKQEALRMEDLYRKGCEPLFLENKIALIVDDGAATGATIMVAIAAAKAHGVRKIIVALPVAAHNALAEIADYADELVCVEESEMVVGISQFYTQFPQVTDDEVIDLMNEFSVCD